MGNREALGAADVTDAELAAIVAGWLSEPAAELVHAEAESVPYDLAAITTAGRFWVRGAVSTAGGERPFEFFVKHVQAWHRSPLFAQVPAEFQQLAKESVPWYTEPLVYRSDLAERLPKGLAMPRAVAVRDLDESSAAIWLERVPSVQRSWSVDDLARAAHLLGRLAASPAVRPLASIGEQERAWPVRSYVQGRLSLGVLPMLRDRALWQHPLIAGAFDPELLHRMLVAADAVPDFLAELERAPLGTAHGDACTNNFLVQPDSRELVLIDYGFWSTQPLGFDLSQLILGDVQLGRRPASSLPAVEAAVLPAYLAGLRREGSDCDPALVARTHALCMLIYSGLSAFPLEHLAAAPTADLHRIAAERAAAARFMLDLAAIP